MHADLVLIKKNAAELAPSTDAIWNEFSEQR